MKFFKKSDILIVGALLLLSIVAFLIYQNQYANTRSKAEIYYYSSLVETVQLSGAADRVFSVPEAPEVLLHLHADGSISFEASDCPDKVCIHAGKIHTVGQTAACIPNGILIKIVPDGEFSGDEADLIIGS